MSRHGGVVPLTEGAWHYEVMGSETQNCPPVGRRRRPLLQDPREEHSPKRVGLKGAFGEVLRGRCGDPVGCGKKG